MRTLQTMVTCAGLWVTTGGAEASPSLTETLYERMRPAVVEIKTYNSAHQGLTSVASGFVVQRNDWIATNYHAIHRVVFSATGYSLQVVTQDSVLTDVEVLAVDVVNDLALLKLKQAVSASLPRLRETLPAKGETGYSMGKPGNYLQSIVGGTFNGLIDDDSAPQIVFSGPINAGMSGGPVLDNQGRVVGVNVATSTRHQLVGLAVPAEALGQLIRKSIGQTPPGADELRLEVARQIKGFGQQLVARLELPAENLRRLGPFTVRGDMSSRRPCRTKVKENTGPRYRLVEQRCEASDGLYVRDKQTAGEISSGTFWFHSKTLGSQGMSRLVERQLSQLRNTQDDDLPTGNWQCTVQRLRGPHDLPIELHACRRPFSKLPGLFDFRFRYTPLISGPDALVVAIGLTGFDNDSARNVLYKSIERLRHMPKDPS